MIKQSSNKQSQQQINKNHQDSLKSQEQTVSFKDDQQKQGNVGTEQNSNDINTVKQKHLLKEQAKSFLLKGCYKFAVKKYKKLILLGAQSLTKRQWAIIHLNLAISLQFQDKLQQALQAVQRAIQIDEKYDKAYYRLLQILQEMGRNQQVVENPNIIPYFIRNQQIDRLKASICEQFNRTLGLSQLQHKISEIISKNQLQSPKMQMYKSSYSHIFQKIIEQVENKHGNISDNLQRQIANHYNFLTKQQSVQCMDYFCYGLKSLLISYNMHDICNGHNSNNKKQSNFLTDFWKSYAQRIDISKLQQLANEQHHSHQQKSINSQIKLIQWFPCVKYDTKLFIKIINKLINTLETVLKKGNRNKLIFETVVKYLYRNQQTYQCAATKNHNIFIKENIENIIWMMLQRLSDALQSLKFDQYRQYTRLNESLLQLYITASENDKITISWGYSTFSSFLFSTKLINISEIRSQQEKYQTVLKGCLQLILTNSSDFECYYIILQTIKHIPLEIGYNKGQQLSDILTQQLINTFQRPFNRIISLQTIVQISSLIRLTGNRILKHANHNKSVQSKNDTYQTIHGILQQMTDHTTIIKYLTQPSNQFDSYSHPSNQIKTFELYVEMLSSVCILSQKYVIQVLRSPNNLLSCILHKLFIKQTTESIINLQKYKNNQSKLINHHIMDLQVFSNAVKLLHVCITDTVQQNYQSFAVKMGVTVQQIKIAHQMQQQTTQLTQKQQQILQKQRKQFNNSLLNSELGKQWLVQIMTQIASSYTINPQNTQTFHIQSMLAQILYKISTISVKKLYSTVIIHFMLQIFKKSITQNKQITQLSISLKISKFISNICMKCNPQIFNYNQYQSLTDILLYGIENAKHQLHIFESLLSLVNLSSQNIKIPLTILTNLLMEDNLYIVHAALQVINNVLVNGLQGDINNIVKVKEITLKYYKYYNEMIMSGNDGNLGNVSDYAYLPKIYCTMISVLMIINSLLKQNTEKIKNVSQQSENDIIIVNELVNWHQASKTLRNSSMMGIIDDSARLMFKLVLHHLEAQRNSLPHTWHHGLQQHLQALKSIQTEKWLKLQKYIQ